MKLIFDWYINEGVSIYEITRRLEAMGVPSPGESGERKRNIKRKAGWGIWREGTIHRILNREAYCGDWYFGKKRQVNGKWVDNPEDYLIKVSIPPIVSRQTWEDAQLKLQVNKENSKRSTKYEYLLSHRVMCGHCLRKMRGHSAAARGKMYLYYVCRAWGERGALRDCLTPPFRADQVDATAMKFLEDTLSSPEKLWEAIENHQREREKVLSPLYRRLEIIESQITQHKNKSDNILNLLIDLGQEDGPRDTLLDKVRDIEKILKGLEEQKRSVIAKVKEAEQDSLSGLTFRTQAESFGDVPQVIDYMGGYCRIISGPVIKTEDGLQEMTHTLYTWEDALILHQQEFEKERQTFAGRRRLIEKYDIRVTLTVEDGQKMVHITGKLGTADLPLVSHTTAGRKRQNKQKEITLRIP